MKRFRLTARAAAHLALLMLSLQALPVMAGLFDTDELLSLTLEAPFKQMYGDRDKSRRYEAMLSYDEEGKPMRLPVELGLRGNFRLQNCRQPGIKVDFTGGRADPRHAVLDGSLFEGQDELKLVAQCKSSGRYEQYLLHEYLVYRAYNQLTELSFRVRLLRLRYLDSTTARKPVEQYAFFIEDKDHVARRNGLEVAKDNLIRSNQLDPAAVTALTLFQYMIGNPDFSMIKGQGDEACCHNAKLFRSADAYYVVPYDFDMTGVINAPYALPPDGLGISEVTERVYRGFCVPASLLEQNVDVFNEGRDRVYATFAESGLLKSGRVKNSHRYIDRFFKIVNTPRRLERQIIDRCRRVAWGTKPEISS